MEKRYHINYNTGIGNFTMKASLEEITKEVAIYLGFTQQGVTVTDNNNNIVAVLPWISIPATDEDIITADYGDFGFYGAWEIYE